MTTGACATHQRTPLSSSAHTTYLRACDLRLAAGRMPMQVAVMCMKMQELAMTNVCRSPGGPNFTPPPPLRDRKKHINFFNRNFLAPTQNPPFWAPRKKFMCLISWERMQKRDPHKLFRGDFWGQKRGPKRAISATKSLVYCLFLPLTPPLKIAGVLRSKQSLFFFQMALRFLILQAISEVFWGGRGTCF